MATTLLLSRSSALSPEEISRLPAACVPAPGGGSVIARAATTLPLPEMLQLAVAMGRAVPDAIFSVEEEAAMVVAPQSSGALPLGEQPSGAPAGDPWALLDAGDVDGAVAALSGKALDNAGRERVRLLFNDRNPDRVAAACRVAAATAWKSSATNMRSLLRDPHPVVREAAVRGLADVAGPSVGPAVKPLLEDPDASVKAAAAETLKRIGW